MPGLISPQCAAGEHDRFDDRGALTASRCPADGPVVLRGPDGGARASGYYVRCSCDCHNRRSARYPACAICGLPTDNVAREPAVHYECFADALARGEV